MLQIVKVDAKYWWQKMRRWLIYSIIWCVCVCGVAHEVQAITLSPKHETDVKQAQLYLNTLGTFVADFTQTVPALTSTATGTIWLKRPGNIRWHYNDPTPVDIAIRGDNVTYYDRELNQISHTTLEDTLAAFLTRKHIDFFASDIEIVDFMSQEHDISITVVHKQNPDQGRLTLVFTLFPKVILQGLKIQDGVGQETFISFFNQTLNKPIDDSIFVLVKPIS